MEEKKVFLTPEQAESVLLKGDNIHTFRSGERILIGADWSRRSIIEAFNKNPDKIEIGGPSCKNMGHGLVVWTSENDPLFVECDTEKLEAFETSEQIKL